MREAILASGSQPQKTFTVTNPATLAEVAQVADCGADEAQAAIEASVQAFTAWKQKTAYERAAVLMRWRERLLAEQQALGELMSSEMGKPIREAVAEIGFSASFLEYYAEEAKRLPERLVPSQFAHKRLLVRSEPVGVVYAVTPWNFPASMVARKVAPALAAGCTFMLKPAELAPLTALRLAELWLEVGGPEGVLQVLPTSQPQVVTQTMMQDARVRKLTFTGSTAVGKQLAKLSADTLKRVSLELGGHAPFIVFEDADLEAAVEGAIASKFRNAGQTCVCANRFYIHAKVMDEFSQRFTERVQALRVGAPLDNQTDIGPLVSAAARRKADAHVKDAVGRGASVQLGGHAIDAQGYYYQPTVLTQVPADALITHEETFGPVAPLMSFKDDAEVIRLANASDYGLAAYYWTRDLDRLFRVSEALDFGLIGVNDALPSTAQAPFGGVKQSGYGREGGHWGLDEYLVTKFVSLGLGKA